MSVGPFLPLRGRLASDIFCLDPILTMGVLTRFDVTAFARDFRLTRFVETGTGIGNALEYAAQTREFESLLSCEIDSLAAISAIARLARDPRICICRMSSEPFIRMAANGPPTFYWLDAHFPGADYGSGTFEGDADDPVRLPLAHELSLLRDTSPNDVILIDDLRLYEAANYEYGPVEPEVAKPRINGADWIREWFAQTHYVHTLRDQHGFMLLLPRGA